MKRIVLFLIVFLLFFGSFSFCDEQYTLSSVIDRALKNSTELKIATLKLSNAQIDYKKTQANNLLTQSKSVELQGEISLLNAQDSYYNTRYQLILSIVNEAVDMVKDEVLINLNQKQVELYEKNLKSTKAQVDAGYKGELDLLSSQNKYDNACFSLQKAKDKYKEDKRKLFEDLVIPLDKKVKISLEEPHIPKIEIGRLIDLVIKNSLILKIRELNVELASINLEKAQKVETPALDLERLKNEVTLSKLLLEKEKKDLLSSFYNKYFLFTQAVSNLSIAKNNLKEKQESYDIIQKQYKAGLKTELDLTQAEVNLLNAMYNNISAIGSYWNAKFALEKFIGKALEDIGKDEEKK